MPTSQRTTSKRARTSSRSSSNGSSESNQSSAKTSRGRQASASARRSTSASKSPQSQSRSSRSTQAKRQSSRQGGQSGQSTGQGSNSAASRSRSSNSSSENGNNTLATVGLSALTATIGVAGGVLLGRTKLQRNRKVLGIPVPNVKVDLADVSHQIGEAGKQFGKLAGEVKTVRERAEQIGKALT